MIRKAGNIYTSYFHNDEKREKFMCLFVNFKVVKQILDYPLQMELFFSYDSNH